jgi:hypothetical protein
VLPLIEKRADPNQDFGVFRNSPGGMNFAGGPLLLAILKQRGDWVDALLAAGADPQGMYKCELTTQGCAWYEAPTLFVCAGTGQVDMVKRLLAAKGSLDCVDNFDCNLLGIAAYWGNMDAMSFFLEQKIDYERAHFEFALFAGNCKRTPLHHAVLRGKIDVVRALLEAGASVNAQDEFSETPLWTAIDIGNPAMVEELVVAKANVFHNISLSGQHLAGCESGPLVHALLNTSAQEVTRHPERLGFRIIDAVLEGQNPVIVESLATGFKKNHQVFSQLTSRDIVRLLQLPGACAEKKIIQGMFYGPIFPGIRYWERREEEIRAVELGSGFINLDDQMAVAEGPSIQDVNRMLDDKQTMDDFTAQAMARLAPREKTSSREALVTLEMWVCTRSGVHNDLEFMLALAACEDKSVFEEPACKALLLFKYSKAFAAVFATVHLMEVLNLTFINVTLSLPRETSPVTSMPQEEQEALLFIAMWLAAGILIASALLQAAQALGYFTVNLQRQWIRDPTVWVEGVVLASTIYLILCVNVQSFEANDDVTFNLVMGLTVFTKWIRFIYTLASVSTRVGTRVLPIIATLYDIGPFMMVFALSLLGATNMFYALNLNTPIQSLLLTYDASVHGNIGWDGWRPNGDIVDDKDGLVRVFVIIVTFLLGLAMLNLFIAVLSHSFDKASEVAHMEYRRFRCYGCISQHAVKSALCKLAGVFGRACGQGCEESSLDGGKHLWFSIPRGEEDNVEWDLKWKVA